MQKETLDKCKVCGEKTNTVFNINLKAIPVCNNCARKIARQEIDWMFDNN